MTKVEVGMVRTGNWKIEEDGDVFIKVVNFPVPKGSPVAGESMWVKKTSGTDNFGQGTLENVPAFCEEVSFGDLVKYEGGTDEEKPRFAGSVEDNNG